MSLPPSLRRLPPPVDSVVHAVLDRARGLAVTASAAVLPLAARVVGTTAGAGRRVVLDVGQRLGVGQEPDTVVQMWPPGARTPADAHAAAEAALAEAAAAGDLPGDGVVREDLPVDNWDGLTIAVVRQRVRSLGLADVRLLLAYEREHAARPAVLLTLERRLTKLTGDGLDTSTGD